MILFPDGTLNEDRVRSIAEMFEKHRDQLDRNTKVLEALDDTIAPELERAIKRTYTEKSRERMFEASPRINFFRRVTSKVSKVYLVPPLRTLPRRDQKLGDAYTKALDLDETLARVNLVVSACRRCAVEFYTEEEYGKKYPRARILTPDMYFAFSDNKKDPCRPTEIVKIQDRIEQAPGVTKVIMRVLASDGWADVDEDGNILGFAPHSLETLPAVHISSQPDELNPAPDEDCLKNSIRLVLTLGDLFYATHYQSHSQVYTIDAKLPKEMTTGGDVVIPLATVGDGKKAEIKVVSPEVQVEKGLALLGFFLDVWLDSKDLRVGAITSNNLERAPSAFSKIIDEADATKAITAQFKMFARAERALWHLIYRYHDVWKDDSAFFDSRSFKGDPDEIVVDFNEVSPDMSEERQLSLVSTYLRLSLLDRKRALKMIKPNLTDAEIDQYIAEADADPHTGETHERRADFEESSGRVDQGDDGSQDT